jgi:hypothetical protein
MCIAFFAGRKLKTSTVFLLHITIGRIWWVTLTVLRTRESDGRALLHVECFKEGDVIC